MSILIRVSNTWPPSMTSLDDHFSLLSIGSDIPEDWDRTSPPRTASPRSVRPARPRTLYTKLHDGDGDVVVEEVPPPSDPVRAPRPITKRNVIQDDDWRSPNLTRTKSSRKNIVALPTCPVLLDPVPDFDPLEHLTAVATPHGTMSMMLRGRVRVDMTIDQAVRVINYNSRVVMAMSASGGSVGMMHPNGKVWQIGSRVEIVAYDPEGNNKYAKMSYKGVGFTSDNCALIYLVDAAGTRTTTDHFADLNGDFTVPTFYEDSRHGPQYVEEAMRLLKAATYWRTEDTEDNWCVNGVRITQTPDGLVKIARNSNKYRLRTSPLNGSASLTTPFLHCTASMGQTRHLFVRRGERRMHFDGVSFIVRNAGHSAGFDDKNQVKVY